MSFTGKAIDSSVALPELAEDLSDIVSIVSPYETPLLAHLGDPPRAATSTYHEWLEDRYTAEGDCERCRIGSWTQQFAADVRVNGAALEGHRLSVADELDYQKQERLRELLRALEAAVIAGPLPAEPADSVQRAIKGIIAHLTTNVFSPGQGDFPNDAQLTEAQLACALSCIRDQAAGQVDTIVVNGFQKRRINSFLGNGRAYGPEDVSYRDLVSMYESDFGVCRVVLSRAMHPAAVLLLDSTRINVLPLAGVSFHYRPQLHPPNQDAGKVYGEYTLELRNENAHGIIAGLATA